MKCKHCGADLGELHFRGCINYYKYIPRGFKTRQELHGWIASHTDLMYSKKYGFWYDSGTYVCAHGEYERPEYYERRYKDGLGIHKRWFFYPGTYGTPQDGRIDRIVGIVTDEDV